MMLARAFLNRLAREESGVTLFEVLMSAVLLAIVSVGVLKTFDTANATSGFTKARAVASDVASEDLERMRGYTASRLNGLDQTRTRPVAGVNYTVRSQTQWLADSSGTRSCTSSTDRAEYLKLTSTVTWPGQRRDAEKVVQTSLFAPPNGSYGDLGGMGIRIQDRDGNGVAGVLVTASGPANLSGTTTADGCVFFAYIKTGTYTVGATKSGYVDTTGDPTPTRTEGVEKESTTVDAIDYDQAGSLTAKVSTKKNVGPGKSATPIYVDPDNLTLGHSQFPSPGTKAFNLAAQPGGMRSALGTFTYPSLFPFTGSYISYSGNCSGNIPGSYAGRTTPAKVVPRGGNAQIDVYEPAVRVKWPAGVGALYFGNSAADGDYAVSKAGSTKNVQTVVKLTALSPCAGTKTFNTTTDSANNNQGWLDPTGTDSDPSVPVGRYQVCISSVAKIVSGNTTTYTPVKTTKVKTTSDPTNGTIFSDPNGEEIETSSDINDYIPNQAC